MRVHAIEINNLTTGMMCGGVTQQGSLNFKVDRIPAEAIYERHGKFLISNTDGVWRHFTIGSQGGFAGRTFKLKMKGGKVFKDKGWHYEEFEGNLWDSAAGHEKCEELAGSQLISIALRSSSDRCQVYCGGYLFSLEEVIRKIGHLVTLSNPTQNQFIDFGG
ncbi:hypothetical protein VPHD485_0291 [Vibrio phage D485]